MDFAEPKPLTDVLAQLDARTPLGSAMRSADWQAAPQELRDGAFFSAGVTDARFLAQQQQAIRDMIARARETNAAGQSMWKMDRSRFVAQLRQMGEAMGVKHPDGRKGGVNEKDITDPISIARLKLVVNTQLDLAYGYGQYLTAMDPDLLSEWPAWELVRITPRKAPRNWLQRWADAGGVLHDGRMIALKTDPIWSKISRFGKPHPPFDYNSGMGVEEIDVDTADALGVMKGNSAAVVTAPPLDGFASGLESSVADLGPGMQARLKAVAGSKIKISDGVAKPVVFNQPSFEPSKGGGRIEVDAKLSKAIETAAVNDQATSQGRAALEMPPAKRAAVRTFENSIRGTAVEHAELYNAKGARVGQNVGSENKVSFPVAKCLNAIMTHRHPQNTPPGLDDVKALMLADMREVRAVADDGVYSIRPGEAGTGQQAYDAVLRAWHALDPQVDAVLSRLMKAHQWSPAEYARRYLQAMYSVLAQRGIISYSYEPFP